MVEGMPSIYLQLQACHQNIFRNHLDCIIPIFQFVYVVSDKVLSFLLFLFLLVVTAICLVI